MSTDTTVDFRSKINEEDSQLISQLYAISKKSPKLIRSTEYDAPADPSIKLRSWKMNEHKYYDIPSPFPTLARGLFTQEVQVGNETKYRIVARGYDKFFNIGEVPWNTWPALEEHTTPPYTLTLKSNGCIIFIAALTPTKLLVTSKHAMGFGPPGSPSHAEMGWNWLKKHLAAAGKTEEQLAATLWEKNWTAVAELCDDSFEEHVLPYPSDKTGLHLHGLNACSKHFRTELPQTVNAFAQEWGFIQTPSTELSTIPAVREFTDEISKTGKWKGEALEGFVVRTHVSLKSPPTKGNKPASASPYEPGSSFFFKVKFDEPYMMYRDWREVTKTLLSKGPTMSNVPKSKLRRPETRVYVKWVIEEIQRDRSQFSEYTKGRGIIATRERFLKWLEETKEGRKALEEVGKVPPEREAVDPSSEQPTIATESSASVTVSDPQKQFGKTIIVPIAIPGVGKTTLAVALTHLFGFGHTQSDDVKAKKAAPVFIKNVVDLLKRYDVVIADKNNHLRQHRKQLRDATAHMRPPVRLLALNYTLSNLPKPIIHSICAERIAARGVNHQSLISSDEHEAILWRFINQSEELAEDEVDVSVEMDVREDVEKALKRVVNVLVDVLGVERPSDEKIHEALEAAKSYKPKTIKQPDPPSKAAKEQEKKKAKEPRYYALVPSSLDLVSFLKSKLVQSNDPSVPDEAKKIFEELVANNRTGDRIPHVTLVHSKSLNTETEEGKTSKMLWEKCKAAAGTETSFTFRLDKLVWNQRVMAISISDLSALSESESETTPTPSPQTLLNSPSVQLITSLPPTVKSVLHITVGTRRADIPPVEAKELVGRWKQGKTESDESDGGKVGVWSLAPPDVWVNAKVEGLYK
ncbi:hypothetical protein K474DRAFT_1665656 [Panus rudis PR-1116 ss-1]|nr:hypothetical protein K474DRAFT_1665656 [Panus rudis PR-1116 ss-1]